MRRIKTLFGIGLALGALLVAIQVQALSAGVSHAENFAALGDRARTGQMPILLVVSQADCPYCELLKREILEPMLISGEYDGRVLIRELLIDSELPVRDFDGQAIAPDALARRYRARLTPTVLFLDHRGRELTERMIGINTVDFYPYYLDAAIDAARERLRAD
jgi:thioredoxin-related protein